MGCLGPQPALEIPESVGGPKRMRKEKGKGEVLVLERKRGKPPHL